MKKYKWDIHTHIYISKVATNGQQVKKEDIDAKDDLLFDNDNLTWGAIANLAAVDETFNIHQAASKRLRRGVAATPSAELEVDEVQEEEDNLQL